MIIIIIIMCCETHAHSCLLILLCKRNEYLDYKGSTSSSVEACSKNTYIYVLHVNVEVLIFNSRVEGKPNRGIQETECFLLFFSTETCVCRTIYNLLCHAKVQ